MSHSVTSTDEPTAEEFYRRIQVEVNEEWKENGADFINPVQVAEMFADNTGLAAWLAHEAEQITAELNDLSEQDTKLERQQARLRRQVLADNLGSFKASYNTEAQDAFIFAAANEADRAQLLRLEQERDEVADKVAAIKPRSERNKHRLKVLERNMEYAKQYLDYDKLMTRIAESQRNRR
jgi:chorismate mutase